MATGNIQEQLNRLRASLDPSKLSSTPVPNQYVPQLGGGQYAPLHQNSNIMPLAAMATGQSPSPPLKLTIVKKYGKYIFLALVVVMLGVLFVKRRKAMTGKKKVSQLMSATENASANSFHNQQQRPGQYPEHPGYPQHAGHPQIHQQNPQQYSQHPKQQPPQQQHPQHNQQQHQQQHPQHNQQQHPQQQQHRVPVPAPSSKVSDPNFTSL